MSIKVMSRVWAHSQQKSGELLVMLALADFADDDGVCWPSIPVLAQKARLTERQVQYVLPKLEKAGELQVHRSNGGRNHRNRYVITVQENGANISLKNIHRNNFSEIRNTETVKPTSPALNRHRTVNKNSGAKAPHASSHHPKERKLTRRGAGIPPEIQPAVFHIIGRINELAGTQYRDDKPGALRDLIARLNDGHGEAECLAVVESRYAHGRKRNGLNTFALAPFLPNPILTTTCRRRNGRMATATDRPNPRKLKT